MEYGLLIAGTVLGAVFCILVMGSTKEDLRNILLSRVIGCGIKIRKLEYELDKREKLAQRRGETDTAAFRKSQKKWAKKLKAQEKERDAVKKGKSIFSSLPMLAGYCLMRIMRTDNGNSLLKQFARQCEQVEERSHAAVYARYLYASLLGYCILGVAVTFCLMGVLLGTGYGSTGMVAGVVAGAILALYGYFPYSDVKEYVNDRDRSLEREFPEAMSKMALLSLAGMGAARAWKMTSQSGEGVLYHEMRRTVQELENNIPAAKAYDGFIRRCNYSYATKLATAMLQAGRKGNDEIAALFRQLNTESWMERSNNARKMGEEIKSKLLVPTIIMFFGIIILVVVPMLSQFNI